MSARVTGIGPVQARLRAITERLRRPETFLRAEAAELERVVVDAIRGARSPSGVPWAPRKSDGAPALQGFARSVFASVSKGRVRVEIAHPAASIHAAGWENAPSRMALPLTHDGEPDGSPFWTERAERVDDYFSAADLAGGT